MFRSRLRLELLEERTLLSTLTVFQRQLNPLASFFAIGGAGVSGTNQPGRVQVRRLSDGSIVTDFAPFGPTYQGSVTVAVGDVNNDGIDDLIVGRADGTADGLPQVKIFDGVAFQNGTFQARFPDLSLLGQFSPYEARFHVGVNVAAGDIENNGFADIITAPTDGNPDVRVFSGQALVNHFIDPVAHPFPNPLAQWFAYGLYCNVGANVAAGAINGHGPADHGVVDIVTGATRGNPHVKVYNGQDLATGHFNPNTSSLLASFFAYDLGRDIGAFVAIGDSGNYRPGAVITGQTTGGSLVKVFDGSAIASRTFNSTFPDNNLLDQFFAFDPGQATGVTVASSDFEVPGRFEILTGEMGQGTHFRVVRGQDSRNDTDRSRLIRPRTVNGIDGFAVDMQGGIFVGA